MYTYKGMQGLSWGSSNNSVLNETRDNLSWMEKLNCKLELFFLVYLIIMRSHSYSNK